MIEALILILIFGYAAWTLFRFFKRSKQGKCSGCAMKKGCSINSCDSASAKSAK